MTPAEIEWYDNNTLEKKIESLSNSLEKIIYEKKPIFTIR